MARVFANPTPRITLHENITLTSIIFHRGRGSCPFPVTDNDWSQFYIKGWTTFRSYFDISAWTL